MGQNIEQVVLCYNMSFGAWLFAECPLGVSIFQFGTYTSISPRLMLRRVVTVEFLKINLINLPFENKSMTNYLF